MKVYDILYPNQQQLDEAGWKSKLAAGTLAAGLAMGAGGVKAEPISFEELNTYSQPDLVQTWKEAKREWNRGADMILNYPAVANRLMHDNQETERTIERILRHKFNFTTNQLRELLLK